MDNRASYDDVSDFINAVAKMTDDNIDEVYDMFVNNKSFQNIFNIKQLGNILNKIVVSHHNDYNCITKLLTKFIEKYTNHLFNNLLQISFPDNCDISITYPTGETLLFNDTFYTNIVMPNTIITIYKNDNMIISIIVNSINKTPNNESYISLSSYYYNLSISENLNISVKFGDISNITPFTTDYYYNTLYDEEIVTIIKNDDVDKLQSLLSRNDDINGCFIIETIPNLFDSDLDEYIGLTLIQLAIYHKSIKCFKYLYLSGYYTKDELNDKLLVIGGNIEILKIVERDDKINDYDTLLTTAIRIHNNNLAKSLFYNHSVQDIGDLLRCCLSFYNYEMLDFVINNVATTK